MTVVAQAASHKTEEHREHGAHIHGVGTLAVATTDTEISIELVAPAYNLIGFGHQPSTAEQQKLVNEALTQLNQGSALFVLNAQADCRFQSTSVQSPFKHAEIDHIESQAGASNAKDHEPASEAYNEEHEEDEQIHAQFRVNYTLNCANAQSIESLDTMGLFEQFPNFEHLKVQWLTDTQQSAVDLDHDNTLVRLQ